MPRKSKINHRHLSLFLLGLLAGSLGGVTAYRWTCGPPKPKEAVTVNPAPSQDPQVASTPQAEVKPVVATVESESTAEWMKSAVIPALFICTFLLLSFQHHKGEQSLHEKIDKILKNQNPYNLPVEVADSTLPSGLKTFFREKEDQEPFDEESEDYESEEEPIETSRSTPQFKAAKNRVSEYKPKSFLEIAATSQLRTNDEVSGSLFTIDEQ